VLSSTIERPFGSLANANAITITITKAQMTTKIADKQEPQALFGSGDGVRLRGILARAGAAVTVWRVGAAFGGWSVIDMFGFCCGAASVWMLWPVACSDLMSVWVLLSFVYLLAKVLSTSLGRLVRSIGGGEDRISSSMEDCGTGFAGGVVVEGCVSEGMFDLHGCMQHRRWTEIYHGIAAYRLHRSRGKGSR
jgi:hypothetical protein